MIQLLLLLSVSTIACILCNKITAKIGIPMLLAFLCVGMLCGEDGILGISFNDYQLTENGFIHTMMVYMTAIRKESVILSITVIHK